MEPKSSLVKRTHCLWDFHWNKQTNKQTRKQCTCPWIYESKV